MYFPDLSYLWSEANHSEGERESTALNFYHELGHVLDFSLQRHGYRLRWFEIMHYEAPESARQARELITTRNPSLWFSALDAEGEPVIPEEQFAQAYDYCAEGMGYQEMQDTMRSTYWGFSYDPSPHAVPRSLPPDQHALIAPPAPSRCAGAPLASHGCQAQPLARVECGSGDRALRPTAPARRATGSRRAGDLDRPHTP